MSVRCLLLEVRAGERRDLFWGGGAHVETHPLASSRCTPPSLVKPQPASPPAAAAWRAAPFRKPVPGPRAGGGGGSPPPGRPTSQGGKSLAWIGSACTGKHAGRRQPSHARVYWCSEFVERVR